MTVTIFIHIPKTAGSSLQSVLTQNYDVGRAVRFEGPDRREVLASYGRAFQEHPETELVYGHFPFGAHLLLDRPWRYFCMLRHPVDRLMSEYYYARSWSGHRFHRQVNDGTLSLEAFLLSDHWFMGNIQTLYLAAPNGRGVTSRLLEIAKTNLRERVACFGLTECFDESVVMLAKAFDWSPPLYLHRNVTPGRHGRGVLPDGLRQEVEDKLRYDMALYGYGQSLFDARCRAVSSLFAEAVAEIRAANAALNAGDTKLHHDEYHLGREVEQVRARSGRQRFEKFTAYMAEPVPPPPAQTLTGEVERVVWPRLSGWARDVSVAGKPVAVDIAIDGIRWRTVVAGIERPDLASQFPGNTRIGFEVVLPAEVRGKSVQVCFSGTGWPLEGGDLEWGGP